MFERVPPHSLESERALLGALMYDATALAKVLPLLQPGAFYHPSHQTVYKHMQKLTVGGKPVDMITLTDSLRDHDELMNIGGIGTIQQLALSSATSGNATYYAKQIHKHSVLRQLIHASAQIAELAFTSADEELDEILLKAEGQIFGLSEQGKSGGGLQHIDIGLWQLYEALEKAYHSGVNELRQTYSTGFTDLDGMLGGGPSPGDLIILAARPAMGKTALAVNIGLNMARKTGLPTAIFNLEMSQNQLITRMLAMESGLSSRNLRAADMHSDQWEDLTKTVADLSEAAVYIDDSSLLSPGDVLSKGRRLKTEAKGIGCIIIDYLQLMSGGDQGKGGNRQNEIAYISRSLKLLARELEVPVIALSQLSRAVESRADKRPMLADLRESGSLEQDADAVIFLYRDEYYNPDSLHQNVAEVIIAKHRNGPTGTVRLFFNDKQTKFDNLALEDDIY